MQCANPDCEFLANPDPEVSIGYCCEKCEGRAKGEAWALSLKGKKHTAYCTSNADKAASIGSGGGEPLGHFAPLAMGVQTPEVLSSVVCAAEGCELPANGDPEVSLLYCCEKCEGRANGEEWALTQKGKKHTAYCTGKKLDPSDPRLFTGVSQSSWVKSGGGGAGAWGGGGDGWGASKPQTTLAEPYDPSIEAMLDEWVEAKRAKDFASADSIRDLLRAQGVEPAEARPDPKKAGGWGGGGDGDWMAQMMGMMGMDPSWGPAPQMGKGAWGPY